MLEVSPSKMMYVMVSHKGPYMSGFDSSSSSALSSLTVKKSLLQIRKTWPNFLQKRALVTSNDSRLFLFDLLYTQDKGSSKVKPLSSANDTCVLVRHTLPVDMIAYKPA